jgi:hypothetical protein
LTCFGARERFFSDEAKAEKLGWFPPELLITDRQAKRMRKLAASEKVSRPDRGCRQSVLAALCTHPPRA